jgi:hypothetical protein
LLVFIVFAGAGLRGGGFALLGAAKQSTTAAT